MANRNNANITPNTPDDNDNIDDIADELNDNDTTHPASTDSRANGEMVTGGLSLDELDARGFNDERDEQTRLTLNTPGGDWIKKERWEFEQRVYANDCMPDDIDPSGRTFFIFKGPAETRVVGGHAYTPNMFLRMSPDIRWKPDAPDTIDMAHKLFMRARDLYLEVRGEKSTPRKLIAFLESEEYAVNTMPGNGGGSPYITDVKKIFVRKR
jgi:hypothetical protein